MFQDWQQNPIKTTTEMTETSQKTTTPTTLPSQANPSSLTSQANPTTTIFEKSTTMKAGSSGQTEGTHLCFMAMLYRVIQ